MNFTAVDLSKLPLPAAVQTIDLETIIQELRDDLIERLDDATDIIDFESEPIVKVLEVAAYRESLLRNQVNQTARAVMVASASGSDLDNLAAIVPLQRHQGESDEDFRKRVYYAPAAFSIAGPRGAYEALALNVTATDGSVLVKDALAESSSPSVVTVTVMGASGDGVLSQADIDLVDAALTAESVRPLTDMVMVQTVTPVTYNVVADLQVGTGPDSSEVKNAALAAVQAYALERHRIGRSVTISGLHRALHQPGVENVILTEPLADIVATNAQAPYMGALTVTVNGA